MSFKAAIRSMVQLPLQTRLLQSRVKVPRGVLVQLVSAARGDYNGESQHLLLEEESELACPYFMPVAKLENGNWPHPTRLPLGCGWSGHCTAPGHEDAIPSQDVMQTFCNLGYAGS